MHDLDVEKRALEFAMKAHGDQTRRYSNEPYIVHPIAVAEIVRSVPHTPAMIAAALLHDVVEDTPVTQEEIYVQFGYPVGDLVYWLTDKSRPSDGNRAVRKAIDRDHIAIAPAEAQTIKLADLLDNGISISAHDTDFWRIFRREMLALLDVMPLGDAGLMARARALAEER